MSENRSNKRTGTTSNSGTGGKNDRTNHDSANNTFSYITSRDSTTTSCNIDNTSDNAKNNTQNSRNKNSTTTNISNLANNAASNENKSGALNTTNVMFRTFTNSNGVVAGAVEQSLHSTIVEGPPAQEFLPSPNDVNVDNNIGWNNSAQNNTTQSNS